MSIFDPVSRRDLALTGLGDAAARRLAREGRVRSRAGDFIASQHFSAMKKSHFRIARFAERARYSLICSDSFGVFA
jgi:hypothetical protein